MSVAVPPQAVRDAQLGAQRAGYPDLWPLLLAIAGPESGWRADAVGDGGASFGYLQFYTRGGLGDGHDPAELLDGPSNFALGARVIGDRLAAGASPSEALQPWSTRPAALALYARIQAEGVDGGGGPGGGGDATVAGSIVPLVVLAALAILLLR